MTNQNPANTVEIYYVGFQSSGGALYAACLDCELSPQQQQFQEVNAHDPSEDGSDPPVRWLLILNHTRLLKPFVG